MQLWGDTVGKIILGTDEIKKIYLGSQEVSKAYLGDIEVWSASNLPDWIPNQAQLETVLQANVPERDWFIDFAYHVNNTNYPCTYFRTYTNRDRTFKIEGEGYSYGLEQPYDSSYRGFNSYIINFSADGRGWYFAGVQYGGNQDRAYVMRATEALNSALCKTNLSNVILPSVYEDYR